jgi:hypothetical protein
MMWRFIDRFPAFTLGCLFLPAFLLAGYGYYGTSAVLYCLIFWISFNRSYPPASEWRRWVGCAFFGILILLLLYSTINPPDPIFPL